MFNQRGLTGAVGNWESAIRLKSRFNRIKINTQGEGVHQSLEAGGMVHLEGSQEDGNQEGGLASLVGQKALADAPWGAYPLKIK